MHLAKLLTPILTLIASAASAQIVDCRVDQNRSLVQIFVYKEGPLSALGDNHIISTSLLNGQIRFNPSEPQNADIGLSIPVNSFIVNDPDLRARAGEAFRSRVGDFNRRFTRRGMLGPKVLDAESHPRIHIDFARIAGTPPTVEADLRVTLRGQTRLEKTHIHLRYLDSRLTTAGELMISQKRYGIKPFSILFGGIRVRDRLQLKFDVSADCR